jgi:hypothetical protein
LTTEEKSFVVFTETPQDKEAWMKDFRQYTGGGQGNVNYYSN